jgi:hypothetical protein
MALYDTMDFIPKAQNIIWLALQRLFE